MTRSLETLSVVAFVAAFCGMCCTSARAATTEPFCAHLEVGLGSSTVHPHIEEGAMGASMWAGASMPIHGVLHLGLEVAASSGYELFGTSSSAAGDRSLTSFLLGIETRASEHHDGLFAFLGAGVGHSTASGTPGRSEWGFDPWFEPPVNLTALALGAGVGYRTAGGPGPLGFSIALRTHLMPRGGQIAASVTTMTLGLAY